MQRGLERGNEKVRCLWILVLFLFCVILYNLCVNYETKAINKLKLNYEINLHTEHRNAKNRKVKTSKIPKKEKEDNSVKYYTPQWFLKLGRDLSSRFSCY